MLGELAHDIFFARFRAAFFTPPPQVWEVDLITHGGEAIFAGARLRSVVLHATAHERHSRAGRVIRFLVA